MNSPFPLRNPAACGLSLVTLLLTTAFLPAKPPAGQEPPKQPVPPNIRAAQATQPSGGALQPKTNIPPQPQSTVVLKPGEVPKVEFDTPIFDAGKVRAGKDIEHDFWFHNTGNGPLEIVQVKPSCGCTTSGAYDHVVEPGKSGKIPIKVATGHFSGAINKSVTIVTNQPGDKAMVTLQIKGEMWQIIQATPNSALFGNVSSSAAKEGPLTRKLTISSNHDKPVTLGEVKSSSPAFKGELKELEPGKKWELTVTMADQQPNGAISGMIDIDTGISELPKLQISCNAYLVADVDVVPNKLMIPNTRTVALQRDLYVRNNAAKPLHISDIAASNPSLKVGMQETQAGVSYRVSIEIPPDAKFAAEGEKITFKTDNPAYPSLSIPLTESASLPAAGMVSKTPTPAPAIQATPVAGKK